MLNILGIGFACGAGALLRYALLSVNRDNFPWGTLLSNLLASFLIGYFSQNVTDESSYLILSAGFLGGLGAYSALNYEFAVFFAKRIHALAYYSLTYCLGLLMVYVGMSV